MKVRSIKLHSLNEASLEKRRDRHTATGKQTRHDWPAKELNVMESALIFRVGGGVLHPPGRICDGHCLFVSKIF